MFDIHTDKIGDMAVVECEAGLYAAMLPSNYVTQLLRKRTPKSWY